MSITDISYNFFGETATYRKWMGGFPLNIEILPMGNNQYGIMPMGDDEYEILKTGSESSQFQLPVEYTSVTVDIDRDIESDEINRSMRNEAKIKVRQSEVTEKPPVNSEFITTDPAGTSEIWRVKTSKAIEAIQAFGAEWECECERKVTPTFRG